MFSKLFAHHIFTFGSMAYLVDLHGVRTSFALSLKLIGTTSVGGCLGWRCSWGKSWTFTCVSIMFLLHHLRILGVVSDATASLKVPLVHDLMNCDE